MERFLKLGMVAGFFVITSCGTSTDSNLQIVGGTKVGLTEAVAQSTVSLSVEKPDGGWVSCSGTLIDPSYVLTAAHCLDGSSGVVLASLKNLDRRTVKNVVHPSYKRDVLFQQFPSTAAHDIAVLKISKPLTNGVPALVAKAGMANGASSVVAGFGETSNRENTDLHKMVKSISFANAGLLEFGTAVSGPHTGWGDSGGPVYTIAGDKLTVAGVVSRTITLRGIDVYTDVGLHAAWIASVIAQSKSE